MVSQLEIQGKTQVPVSVGGEVLAQSDETADR